ncbi:MAG: DNA topology modulation protein FlaR, partial [Clostridia bacterium]|nr:DNA topology modulation protein FlaR [Clostridia bacterium]
RRYRTYRGKTRPAMAKGCKEKMDGEFVKWILWKGRSKSTRGMFRRVRTQYADKTVVLRSQRQLDAFMQRQGL